MKADPGVLAFRKVRAVPILGDGMDNPTEYIHLLVVWVWGRVGKGFLSGPLKCFIGLVNPSLEPVDPVTWSVI